MLFEVGAGFKRVLPPLNMGSYDSVTLGHTLADKYDSMYTSVHLSITHGYFNGGFIGSNLSGRLEIAPLDLLCSGRSWRLSP